MVWVFLLWIVFGGWLIINKKVREFINFKLSVDKTILIPLCLFLLAGIISTFVGGINRAKLGQFIVLFLQPISLFFISGYIIKEFPKAKNYLLTTIYWLLAAAGLYAMLQYFTLHGLPAAWWGNSQEPKRALSFFAHPNFYALWCAPLLAFLLPSLFSPLPLGEGRVRVWWPKMIAWVIGAIGLLLSLSRSGWLGLAAAIGVYLIVAADKKTRKIVLAGAVIVLAVIVYYPNLRYRILLPFYGEKSASSRLELWGGGLKAIKESPIMGLGLTGFAHQYAAINSDPTLDTHNFPHNIFLNFWVETGALGLISFIYIIGLCIYRGLRGASPPAKEGWTAKRDGVVGDFNWMIALSISLFLIAIIFQGLVDNPYFKNDLALVFWIILSLII